MFELANTQGNHTAKLILLKCPLVLTKQIWFARVLVSTFDIKCYCLILLLHRVRVITFYNKGWYYDHWVMPIPQFWIPYTDPTWCRKVLVVWNVQITRQIWGIWKLRPAYSPETANLGQNQWCFVPCDLEIWWMTLENNRASLLCSFKLCLTFHSHRWIQTGVTVRKHPIWVKFYDF